jgi:hypothetical protein
MASASADAEQVVRTGCNKLSLLQGNTSVIPQTDSSHFLVWHADQHNIVQHVPWQTLGKIHVYLVRTAVWAGLAFLPTREQFMEAVR